MLKEEYSYCAVNDCRGTKYLSPCCFFCEERDCPDRCDKKENTFCVCLMKGLKELKEDK